VTRARHTLLDGWVLRLLLSTTLFLEVEPAKVHPHLSHRFEFVQTSGTLTVEIVADVQVCQTYFYVQKDTLSGCL
jgi:hypothetical protein